ncbi:hypothetical protein NA2_20694 [Nitratireductor pacificus pht-3B]|uniref:Uncharacterized protein n=1 Tax=Nitratireductor pacificus pht-3B TaxID=391937 RepID=K2MY17_9HYPH|nr:hypothetical protein NA2_20694 [Nitratireductor pacificus pht-3B]
MFIPFMDDKKPASSRWKDTRRRGGLMGMDVDGDWKEILILSLAHGVFAKWPLIGGRRSKGGLDAL